MDDVKENEKRYLIYAQDHSALNAKFVWFSYATMPF